MFLGSIVKNVYKISYHIYACNMTTSILCKYHRLTACTAADICYL